MGNFATREDALRIEEEMPWEERDLARTMHDFLADVASRHGTRDAVSFQITSGPKDKVETLTWAELHGRTCQVANLFRSLGIGEKDVVAYLLPNCNETVVTLLGGMIAGIVNPINPLLEPEQIGSILRDTGAKISRHA